MTAHHQTARTGHHHRQRPGHRHPAQPGPHKDRLIIPFNEGPYGRWQNYAVFSDDAGKTWTYGDDVPGALVPDGKGGERSQINEVQMAELPDGSVLLDSRQFAGAKVRRTSLSQDGGRTWSPVAGNPGTHRSQLHGFH